MGTGWARPVEQMPDFIFLKRTPKGQSANIDSDDKNERAVATET